MTYILGELGKKKHKYSNNISKIILINLGRANEKKKVQNFDILRFICDVSNIFLSPSKDDERSLDTRTQAPFIDYVHWGK